jgi:hypothetical protein
MCALVGDFLAPPALAADATAAGLENAADCKAVRESQGLRSVERQQRERDGVYEEQRPKRMRTPLS